MYRQVFLAQVLSKMAPNTWRKPLLAQLNQLTHRQILWIMSMIRPSTAIRDITCSKNTYTNLKYQLVETFRVMDKRQAPEASQDGRAGQNGRIMVPKPLWKTFRERFGEKIFHINDEQINAFAVRKGWEAQWMQPEPTPKAKAAAARRVVEVVDLCPLCQHSSGVTASGPIARSGTACSSSACAARE